MMTAQQIEDSSVPLRKSPPFTLKPGQGLIVEFVGPTGSGKTTNCQYFSDLLNKTGLKTYLFKDVKRFLTELEPSHRFRIYLNTLLNKKYRLTPYIWLLARNGIFSLDAVYRYIKLCIFNTAAEAFMQTRRVDVLLLDQWIVQGLWSATIFRAGSYASLQDKLPEFYFPSSCLLFFDVDEETACSRIESRKGGRSRFDRMHPAKRLVEMKRYNTYLHHLFENSECIHKMDFSTKIDPRENARRFLQYLQFTFQKDN